MFPNNIKRYFSFNNIDVIKILYLKIDYTIRSLNCFDIFIKEYKTILRNNIKLF